MDSEKKWKLAFDLWSAQYELEYQAKDRIWQLVEENGNRINLKRVWRSKGEKLLYVEIGELTRKGNVLIAVFEYHKEDLCKDYLKSAMVAWEFVIALEKSIKKRKR